VNEFEQRMAKQRADLVSQDASVLGEVARGRKLLDEFVSVLERNNINSVPIFGCNITRSRQARPLIAERRKQLNEYFVIGYGWPTDNPFHGERVKWYIPDLGVLEAGYLATKSAKVERVNGGYGRNRWKETRTTIVPSEMPKTGKIVAGYVEDIDNSLQLTAWVRAPERLVRFTNEAIARGYRFDAPPY